MRSASVIVSAVGSRFMLTPGMSCILSADIGNPFRQVLQKNDIAYRNSELHNLKNGLQALTSEFSVPSALQSVAELKRYFNSDNPEAYRIVSHILKTAAAKMQLKPGGAPYQKQAQLCAMSR
jgi:hypothetical protein